MVELIDIQSKLQVPKSQYNKFGKYNYRTCEDILEAVKPLLKDNNCVLNLSDIIKQIGDRYYIEATATITNSEGQSKSSIAYAREEQEKKGMDGSQITGSASSYARKYALNGLFCIDDSRDFDGEKNEKEEKTKEQINQEKIDKLIEYFIGNENEWRRIAHKLGINDPSDMSLDQIEAYMGYLSKKGVNL